MVQIFKVTEHAERKRVLREQSDLYREMLTAEVGNIGMSVNLLRRKYAMWKSLLAALSVGTSLGGLLLALRRSRKPEAAGAEEDDGARGLFSRLLSGVELVGFLRSVIKKFQSVRSAFRGGEEE